MKKNLLGLFMIATIFIFPVLVSAQVIVDTNISSSGFSACSSIKNNGVAGIVSCIMAFFNAAVYLLIAAGVVYVIYGAFKLISSEEGRDEAKQTIYYGIIGLFVMVSIWGLVNILDNTFRLSNQGPLPAPQFQTK